MRYSVSGPYFKSSRFNGLSVDLPSSWVGLFKALADKKYSDRKADIWYQESVDSGYGHQPDWSSLFKSLIVHEPYIREETQQLSFLPKLLHLPEEIQAGFLQFLHRHCNRIPDCEIKAFITKLEPFYEMESPASAHLKLLKRCMKTEEEETTVIHSERKVPIEDDEEMEEVIELDPAEVGKIKETREITDHDDIICIEDDSNDSEPKAKRRKLEIPGDGANVVANLDTNTEEGREEVASHSYLHAEVHETNMKEIVTSDVLFEKTRVDDSPKGRITEVPEIDSNSLDQEKEQDKERIRETEHNAKITDLTEVLKTLVSMTTEEMENAVQELDIGEMSEDNILAACGHLTAVSELISYSNCVCFLKFVLCDTVMSLTQKASRVLASAVNMVADKYPKQLTDSLLMPCVKGTFDTPQLDLMTIILKEQFSDGNQHYFLKSIVEGELELNDSKITLLQTLIDITNTDNDILRKIFFLFETQSSNLAKNLKFGKLLLAVANKYGKVLSGENLTTFSNIVDKHQTFLKKSVQNVIKKLR